MICGDAQNGADYDRVLAGKPADLVLTDPPYNVPISETFCFNAPSKSLLTSAVNSSTSEDNRNG